MSARSDAGSFQLRMGAYHEHRGNFKEAKKWYSRAAKRNTPETEFRVGNLEYRSGNFAEAVGHLRKAVAGGVDRYEAVKRLALSLEKIGDRYGAEELVHSEAAKNPSNAELSKLLDSLRVRNGQHELQQLRLEKADSSPGDEDADNAGSGAPQVSNSDPAWLRADFLSARLDDRRKDADWLYNYATVLEEAGRLGDAAAMFDEACALEPSRSWWWYRAGRAYELSESQCRAWERYSRAVETDTKLESHKWSIGVFHHESGTWDSAAREFENAAIDTSEVWRRAGLYYRAGHNHLLAMNLEDAERCLKRALSLRAGDERWARMLADTLELSGKFIEAAGILELLLTTADISTSNGRSTLWDSGRILRQMGNFESSIERLRSALQITDIEYTSDKDDEDPLRVDPLEDLAREAIEASSMMQGSTDRRGHMARARIAQRVHAWGVQEDSLRKAEILSGENSDELAATYSQLLIQAGELARATEVLLRTQVFWGPCPDKFSQPKRGTYAYQLAAYKEWRANHSIEKDLILYESNLGLSVDCNPLALCRNLLAGGRRFIHVWAIDGDITLPEDLLDSADVLVVQKDSLQYTRLLATAKYLVNNSTFPTYFTRRDEQRYLMTWHGTPLKTLAKDMPEPLVHLNMARNYLQATHAIFPNEHTRRVLVERMDLNGLLSAKIQMTGYPRNDVLVNRRKVVGSSGKATNVLYAPTWREDSELESQVEELLRVRDSIVAAGYTALIRAHHYVESAALAVDPEISFVPRRTPTNDLLPEVDILITDFSSIYFDFSITGRPILFYTPDWDRYVESRGVYFSKDHLPGPVCDSIEELRRALAQPEVNEEFRRKFICEFAPMDDGRAGERVCREFFELEQPQSSPVLAERNPAEAVCRGLLIRQAFIPNGMTSSFINLVTTLTGRGVPVTVLTDGRSVQNEPPRQGTLARLPKAVRVVGRVGMQAKTMVEYHASVASAGIAGLPSSSLERTLDEMFDFEARRVLPVGGFSAVIEFDGYSEFMARLVRAIGKESDSTAIYLHNDILDEIRLRMPELKGVVDTLPQFDHVVAVSEGSSQVNAEKLAKAYGVDTSKFTFARNLIVPEKILTSSKESLPAAVQEFLSGAELSLVQVGRISPEKNHAFSLDVIAGLREEGIDCRFLIVGDGPLLPSVSTKIRNLGLQEAVQLIGWVDNPYPYIANADAMLLPSHHEGQPMVILEAQTLGTPVLGSQISSLQAMGKDGPQHLLPIIVDAWIECLVKLYRSRSTSHPIFDGDAYVDEALTEFSAALELMLPER